MKGPGVHVKVSMHLSLALLVKGFFELIEHRIDLKLWDARDLSDFLDGEGGLHGSPASNNLDGPDFTLFQVLYHR
jgi:hypothetical protein